MKIYSHAIAGVAVSLLVGVIAAPMAQATEMPTSAEVSLEQAALAPGAYEFEIESTTGASVTMSYRLGSDLTLQQHGDIVAIHSNTTGESSAFPTTLTTSSGKTVDGAWAMEEGGTLTFTFTPAGAATDGSVITPRAGNYWDCVRKTAIGTMAGGVIAGCVVGIETGCVPGATLAGVGGFLGGTVGGLIQC
ncbi:MULTISPECIES: hypothetical protein [unclassified Microbacterium]|uniref:hypothetical protein n=1 Tax=unclassified Microbacterium TaxID=2609290 RepID=UPI001605135B|nr:MULTISPECIES: hypothetical protein [unclassified Microbacterium]QNA93471.1 hypothetical protein G4G29_16275 [Microbacterium sp. Se63.02b]QYM63715.1 hypothetical protein K1X59_16335 [Microbacterium sp. Se5.02b]